jgi:hypothetical protein
MQAMRMPGFSAEASLYRSDAHYQIGAMFARVSTGGTEVIQPALLPYCRPFKTMKGLLFCCSALGVSVCCDPTGCDIG